MAVKQIILVALTVMLGVGCANTEDGMPEEKHEDEPTMPQIAVSASVAASEGASRATPIMSKTDLSALKISVKRNDTDQDYFVDVATPLGNVFSFSTPHYWLPGAPLDFYAYTPSPHLSNLSVGKGTIKFDYTAAVAGVATDGADILTGMDFGLEYGKTQGGVVPIKLSHALAMIEFAVAYEEDAEGNRTSKIGNDIIITEVALHNVARDGICTATCSGYNWTVGSAVEWICADFTCSAAADEPVDFKAADGTPMRGLRVGRDIHAGDLINDADRSKALIVVPGQTLTEMRVSFVEGAPTVYSKTFPIEPITFEPGKYYRFYLSIKSNNVSVWSTKVTDWMEADGGEYTLT